MNTGAITINIHRFAVAFRELQVVQEDFIQGMLDTFGMTKVLRDCRDMVDSRRRFIVTPKRPMNVDAMFEYLKHRTWLYLHDRNLDTDHVVVETVVEYHQRSPEKPTCLAPDAKDIDRLIEASHLQGRVVSMDVLRDNLLTAVNAAVCIDRGIVSALQANLNALRQTINNLSGFLENEMFRLERTLRGPIYRSDGCKVLGPGDVIVESFQMPEGAVSHASELNARAGRTT